MELGYARMEVVLSRGCGVTAILPVVPFLTHPLCVCPVHADIKYGSLLEVDETLKKLRATAPKSGDAMLVEEVGPEEIAGVVSKWTGECVGATSSSMQAEAQHSRQSSVIQGVLVSVCVSCFEYTSQPGCLLCRNDTIVSLYAAVFHTAGIPVSKLQQTEREKLLGLHEELHKRVVGQDAAVDVVASAVLRSRAGLAARNRCAECTTYTIEWSWAAFGRVHRVVKFQLCACGGSVVCLWALPLGLLLLPSTRRCIHLNACCCVLCCLRLSSTGAAASCSWAPPVWARQSSPRPWPTCCLMTRR